MTLMNIFKKSLPLLALGFALSAFAYGDSYTISTATKSDDYVPPEIGTEIAVRFTLDEALFRMDAAYGSVVTDNGAGSFPASSLTLDSISLMIHTAEGSGGITNFGIRKSGGDSLGDVASFDMNYNPDNYLLCTYTANFSGITLTMGETYEFYFTSTKVSARALSDTMGSGNIVRASMPGPPTTPDIPTPGELPRGCLFLTELPEGTVNPMAVVSGFEAPYNNGSYMLNNVSLSLSAPASAPDAPGGGVSGNIPEPTTATLSLLALAGLAARRRRKAA